MTATRILHVHTDLLGGGIEKSLVTLATHTNAGQVGICWCPTNHPPPPKQFVTDLQERVELVYIPPPFLSPVYPVRLWKVIRDFEPTVLHLHGASIGVIGSIIGRLAKVPAIVYTEHCDHSIHALWLQRAREATGFLPHHTVCVSSEIQRSLMGRPYFRGIKERISVIHNGIDLTPHKATTAEDRKAIRLELGLADEARVIASVGLLWYIKGYENLLRAMPRILDKVPQATLVLVGSGEDEAKLRQLAAELRVASRVHFLGWRSDVPRILPAFDLYVQPSLSEGLPMSILEAAATGLPIVAAGVGGIPEVFAGVRNCRLVVPRDEIGLAEAVSDLLDGTSETTNSGIPARDRVVEHFTVEVMARTYTDLYRALLSGAQTPQNS